MRARTWVALTALALGIVTAWPGAAGAATEDGGREPRTITVTGTGLVRGTPDVLELLVGVKTRASSAVEALNRNNAQSRRVIDVLRDAGVEDDDLQTANLSITPFYDEDGTNLEGYTVSNQLSASIRDLDKAGGVIDAATKVAGNEIAVNGVFFSFDDNTELVVKARTDAVKRARLQAEQLAEAAGVELGDLLSLTEDSAPFGPAVEFERTLGASGEADAAAPIEPGSEQLSVQVTLIYEITQ
jgi:hypothetical protein